MKVKTGNRTPKAVRQFTDREEPRASFWKEYALTKSELSGQSNIHVLSYYGIGGIGKTRLLKKLMEEMEEKLPHPVYAYIDFEITQESRRTLSRLKSKLQEKAKFTFPLFDLGEYVYAKKTGEQADSPEVQQLTEKSPFLNLVLSIADNIPVVGIAAKVLTLADQSVAYLRNYLNTHSRELSKIEYLEPEALYRYLPVLFSLDMANNMKNATEPVVIFLDTYERLVNELSQVGEPLKQDEWIRGEDGIVQRIPGVLWVIAGREKLKWERFDPEWKDALQSHILGNLSPADSIQFLEKAGVGGPDLRLALYKLTQGTPVYLDLCVDQYLRMIEQGIQPEVSLFGRDTFDLIERFVRYMGDAQKDYVYLLACLRTWDDALACQIAESVLSNFSHIAYEKTKDLSFIVHSGDGEYHINQTVGQVLMEHCPQAIQTRVGNALVEKFSGTLRNALHTSDAFADALQYVTVGALLVHKDREDLCRFFLANIYDPLQNLISAARFEQAQTILDLLTVQAEEGPQDRFFGELLCIQSQFCCATADLQMGCSKASAAWQLLSSILGPEHPAALGAMSDLASALDDAGQYPKALELNQQLLEKRRRISGEDHPNTLGAMHNLAVVLGRAGQTQKSLELKHQVLEKSRRILGEDDPDTLTAMNNLAMALGDAGQTQKSLEMVQQILEKRRRLLGEDHPDTLTSIHSLAITFGKLNRHKEALDLYQQVLEKRRRILGEDHPKTLGAMNGLACTLEKLGRRQEALELSQQGLEKHRHILGEDHPDTLAYMRDTALLLEKLGRQQEALPLRQQVLEKRRRLLGEDHPDTLAAMNTLGIRYTKSGQPDKALELLQPLLEKRRRMLGEDHPKTLDAMTNVAGSLMCLCQNEEARDLLLQVLEKNRQMLGDQDPKTHQAFRHAIMILDTTGETEKAQALRAKLKELTES